MKTVSVATGILVASAIIYNVGDRVITGGNINAEIYAPIRYALTLQDPDSARTELETVLGRLNDRDLTHGNTCLFYTERPQCSLTNFTRTISQNITLIEELEGSTDAQEQAIVMGRVHQSFTGSDGVLDHPDLNFASRRNVDNPVILVLGKLVDVAPIGILFIVWILASLLGGS